MSGSRAVALAVAASALAVPAGAQARAVSVDGTTSRACHARPLPASTAGVVRFAARAPANAVVRARLTASAGDWDLAVFDRASRAPVVAAAGFKAQEFASGFVEAGQRLIVQACRVSGSDATADVSASFYTLPAAGAGGGRAQLVEVEAGSAKELRRLQQLGLDLTEHADASGVEVVLHGSADAAKLRAAGFEWEVKIADLRAKARADRRADARYAQQVETSGLPSGRTTYRHLWDYEWEMKALARAHPDLVKPLTLAHKTHEGRWVGGIEITRNVDETSDGKPIHLNMGVHHAREWPSSEHSLELAYDLVTNRDVRRTRRILDAVRTIVVPVINPDGFNVSREADPGDPAQDFTAFDYEMKRKNCRPVSWAPDAPCQAIPNHPNGATVGRLSGVDPNRNYGGLWGGPGASVSLLSDTFRGPGPFSEPETQNVRDLHASRNVTTLITNHTYSNLVLRPPGTADTGRPLDDPYMTQLGARMTEHNTYRNIPAYGLYDTTGGTEDWTYWTAGSIGYTFEIGEETGGFHPPYEDGVVGEYLGLAPANSAGRGGNREAYYDMLAATRSPASHSVLSGVAAAGNRLTLSRHFLTSTHDPLWLDSAGVQLGEPIRFEDHIQLALESDGGGFEWHLTPSTRPIVAGRLGRDPTGPPQANVPLVNPPGIPALNPSGGFQTGESESIPFTVQGPADGVDNGRFTVHVEWTDATVDWDLYVVNAAGQVVAQSAAFGDTTEDAVLVDPPPGDYRAIVVNFDQGARNPDPATWDDWTGEVRFRGPDPTTIGPKEAWVMACTAPDGTQLASREVVVDRGQALDVGNACRAPAR
jgi:hypothetical protein